MDNQQNPEKWRERMRGQIALSPESRLGRPLTEQELAAIKSEVPAPALRMLLRSFADPAFIQAEIAKTLGSMSSEFALMVVTMYESNERFNVTVTSTRNMAPLNGEIAFVVPYVEGSYNSEGELRYSQKRPVSLHIASIVIHRKNRDEVPFGYSAGVKLIGEGVAALKKFDLLVSGNWSPLLTLMPKDEALYSWDSD